MSQLKATLTQAMKDAMRSKEKDRLAVIRLALSAIKQIEVDTQGEVGDDQALAALDKMVKQRRESIKQYSEAGRDELVAEEQAEIDVLVDFLPEQASEEEINTLIQNAITETGAESMRDMGKVMGVIRPKLAGRADMGKVSGMIKAQLNA